MPADALLLDWDPRLAALIDADPARLEERIRTLVLRNIDPVVRSATHVHLAVLPAADRADVAAACREKLVAFLRAVHHGYRTVPVADIDAFVSQSADDACRDYLRRTRPDRARLSHRIRLLCTRGTGVVMWRTAKGQLVCGAPSWTHRDALTSPFPWADSPKVWWGKVLSGADGAALGPTVSRVLEKCGAPLTIDTMVDVVSALSGTRDGESRLDASPEGDEPELAVLHVGTGPDHLAIARRYLEQAWRECEAMPVHMRTAVLLSLRDQHGAGLLPVFHCAGVVPLRKVSDALRMKPDELAAIWAHLPWDDRAIGRRLGITGIQVLNLRTAARSRLLRRMALRDER